MKTLFPILVFHIFNNNNSTIMSNYDDSCDDCAGVMTVEELHSSNSLNDLPNLICSSCDRDLVINTFDGDGDGDGDGDAINDNDFDILSVSDLSTKNEEEDEDEENEEDKENVYNMNDYDDTDDLFRLVEEERINYYEELEIEQRVCLVCGNAINLICVPCLNRANQENNCNEYNGDELDTFTYDKYEDIYGDW